MTGIYLLLLAILITLLAVSYELNAIKEILKQARKPSSLRYVGLKR